MNFFSGKQFITVREPLGVAAMVSFYSCILQVLQILNIFWKYSCKYRLPSGVPLELPYWNACKEGYSQSPTFVYVFAVSILSQTLENTKTGRSSPCCWLYLCGQACRGHPIHHSGSGNWKISHSVYSVYSVYSLLLPWLFTNCFYQNYLFQLTLLNMR